MNILLVDDQPDCAYALSKLLMLAGYRVLIANCGREALKLAAANRPEVIVIDFWLPDMRGDQSARHLRNDLGLNFARIISVSGDDLDRETLSRNGIDAALMKPVGLIQLLPLIECVPAQEMDAAFA